MGNEYDVAQMKIKKFDIVKTYQYKPSLKTSLPSKELFYYAARNTGKSVYGQHGNVITNDGVAVTKPVTKEDIMYAKLMGQTFLIPNSESLIKYDLVNTDPSSYDSKLTIVDGTDCYMFWDLKVKYNAPIAISGRLLTTPYTLMFDKDTISRYPEMVKFMKEHCNII